MSKHKYLIYLQVINDVCVKVDVLDTYFEKKNQRICSCNLLKIYLQ